MATFVEVVAYLLSAYQVTDSVQSAVDVLPNLIITTFHLDFTNEETEAQRG